MVTNNDANAAEQAAPVETEATEETEIQKISRESAEWKQKFQSSEGRRKKLEVSASENVESEDRMANFVKDSLEVAMSGDAPEKMREKLEQIGAKRENARQLSARISTAQLDIDKLVSDNSLDWDKDPDLEEARKAWESSKPEDAFRLASLVARERKVQENYTSNDEVDEIVNTKIKNARQDDSRVIDTGNGTAPIGTSQKLPTNQEELVAYMRQARSSGVVISKEKRASLVRGAGGR